MPEIDIGYFDPTVPRRVRRGARPLRQRLVASELGRELYDGPRDYGYGGFHYDGRWQRLLPPIIARYGLGPQSAVLDVGCKKGFFLHDLQQLLPGITVRGIENSSYPIETAMPSVKDALTVGRYDSLPYADGSFDFVMAFSSIYQLDLGGVMRTLREIMRVGRGQSYITLGAYRTEEERAKFAAWTLLGTTVLHVDEWLELFDYVGYRGDYYFTTASSLNLQWAD